MAEEEEDQSLAGSLVRIGEQMTPVIEATAGYRAQLEGAGFTSLVAEQMATHYHALLIEVIRAQVVR